MKTKFNLNEVEVAIKDIKYLKVLKATNQQIEITKKILENNYSPSDKKFCKEDSSDEFKYPFYVGVLAGENMRFIFENSIMLWFPAFYLVGTCLKKSLSPNDYEKWEDNDLNWTNTKNERINIMNVEFKESQFEVSNIKLSHLSEELLLKGKFNKNKIEINIKKV